MSTRPGDTRTWVTLGVLAFVFGLLLAMPLDARPQDAGGDAAGDAAGTPEKEEPEWLSGRVGLERAEKEKQVTLLAWGGNQQEAFWLEFEGLVTGSRPLAKRVKKIVRVRVHDRSDERVVKTIGALDERSTIAVLDFRGVTIERWNGEIPRASVLKRALNKAAKHNAAMAKQYRRVEKIVEKSRYAHRLKKPREAIELLLTGEKQPLPPDSQPVKDLAEIRAKLDAECSEKIEKAQELEENRKLVAALDKYQEIQRDYPFPKRKKELLLHIGRVTRLLGIGN